MNKNLREGFAAQGILVVVGLVLLAGFGYLSFQTEGDEKKMVNSEAVGVMEDKTSEEKYEGVMEKKDGVMEEKKSQSVVIEKSISVSSGYRGVLLAGTNELPLLDFVKADYDIAVASGKLVVLYFYAEWCPLCKAEFPKMQAAFNALPNISSVKVENVVGFKVNYKDGNTDESETALAKEFGVPYQHTKVFVKNGQRILKAPDSWDMERYMREIINALSK